ncbi:MAG: hypothetical protein HY744_14615 [Deltaproteobacteria bacterium]|nr:hypothetical protein [Deltaproteobacteria bacterium]
MWRDPDVTGSAGGGQSASPASAAAAPPAAAGEDDGGGGADGSGRKRRRRRGDPGKRDAPRIVAGPRGDRDPNELERQRLLERLLAAEGRPAISKAAHNYLAGGFELPSSQDVWLQLLEHNDEEMVAEAIARLTAILAEEPPGRRAMLESRLRRIEQLADMSTTREAAARLRRQLVGPISGARPAAAANE